jgi:peptidoglycan/xylan/chitin deacetylase (PgdA/CDA1 family)
LIESLPARPRLLVFNYHRVGRYQECEFDRGVYSVDADGLDEQIRIIKRLTDLVHPDEAVDLIARGLPLRRPVSLLTFDDGYLDNYSTAIPVLETHGASAIFFLVTSYLDDPHQVAWWDKIAFLARRCVGKRIEIAEMRPRVWSVDADNVDAVISEMLAYFRTSVRDEAGFIRDLERCAGGGLDRSPERLFMDWTEAADIIRRGMVVGGHTHTHPILSRLDEAGQRHELSHSKALLEERLGIPCNALAYPVGSATAFSETTKRVAREVGFRCAFAFDGGSNQAGSTDAFAVKRLSLPAYAGSARNRSVVSTMRLSGQPWF